eukprot:2117794-Heterocapsa_arctica.AAC.1
MFDKFSRPLLRMLRHARQGRVADLMETDGFFLVCDLLRNPLLVALGITIVILYHLTTLSNTRGFVRLEVRSDRLAIRAKW